MVHGPAAATPASYFDSLAPSYDRDFTETRLGRELRGRVWARLDTLFPPGAKLLELACGTGEDARYLAGRGVEMVATDHSENMLSVARRKTDRLPVTAVRYDLAALPPVEVVARAPYDGLLTNFGGLNTLHMDGLAALAKHLAPLLRPGAPVVLVVMGRWCAWEIIWHLAHLQPRRAFRRLGAAGVVATGAGEEPLHIYYPSTQQMKRAFTPAFALRGVWPLGLLLPPTYLEPLTRRRWFPWRLMAGLERRLRWPLWADHTVYEFVRQA